MHNLIWFYKHLHVRCITKTRHFSERYKTLCAATRFYRIKFVMSEDTHYYTMYICSSHYHIFIRMDMMTFGVMLSRKQPVMSQDVKHSLKGGILPFTRPLLDAYLQCDFAFDIYLWHREDLWTERCMSQCISPSYMKWHLTLQKYVVLYRCRSMTTLWVYIGLWRVNNLSCNECGPIVRALQWQIQIQAGAQLARNRRPPPSPPPLNLVEYVSFVSRFVSECFNIRLR